MTNPDNCKCGIRISGNFITYDDGVTVCLRGGTVCHDERIKRSYES